MHVLALAFIVVVCISSKVPHQLTGSQGIEKRGERSSKAWEKALYEAHDAGLAGYEQPDYVCGRMSKVDKYSPFVNSQESLSCGYCGGEPQPYYLRCADFVYDRQVFRDAPTTDMPP